MANWDALGGIDFVSQGQRVERAQNPDLMDIGTPALLGRAGGGMALRPWEEQAVLQEIAALPAKEGESDDQKRSRVAAFVDANAGRFFSAAAKGDDAALSALIDQDMPVNLRHPRTGATPLHYVAAIAGRPALRVLLKSGRCNFLLRDRDGALASEVAMVDGDDPAIARLLRRKEAQQARTEGVRLRRRAV